MNNFDATSGQKIADAIDKRIINVSKQLYNNSGRDKTVYGIVTKANNGIFSIKVNNTEYNNVGALRNVGNISIGEKVVCLVPNGNYSDMIILGVADGTIQSGGGPSTEVYDGQLTIQRNGTAVGTFTANSQIDKVINILVPTTAQEVGALPSSTLYTVALSFSYNSNNYSLTVQLKDQNGDNIGSAGSVTLPLSNMVIDGSYDSNTKSLVLEQLDGTTESISLVGLISGLQTQLTETQLEAVNSGITDELVSQIPEKMDKTNPTGSGVLSINRKSNTYAGLFSATIGQNNAATEYGAIAVGGSNTASGQYSFSSGSSNTSSGSVSTAVGGANIASGDFSFVAGENNRAQRKSQFVFGEYSDYENGNAFERGKYIEMVGNGTSSSSRSCARKLDWSGNEILSGTSTATGFKIPNGTSSQFLKANGSVDNNSYQTSLSSSQLNAVNSGIDSSKVSQISTNASNITNLQDNKQDKTDNSLNTTSKTIVGAINELNSGKQSNLSTSQLNAVNSGITSALVSQITTNANNISSNTSSIDDNTNAISSLTSRMGTAETNINSIPNNYVSYSTAQSLTETQKAQARNNIGAGDSSFDGSYTTLTNKPILNTSNTTAQSASASETINGTINLHKVAKTGTASDLIGYSDLAQASSVTNLASRVTTAESDIDTIEGKIPAQASSTNQLTDKDFVNSSINALAAFYITRDAQGDNFDTYSQLSNATTFYSGGQARVPTQNDYTYVRWDESKGAQVSGYSSFTTTSQYVGYYVIYNNEGIEVTSSNKDSVGITAGSTIAYENLPTTRYSYQGGTYPNGQWEFQLIVNNSALTSAQMAALNSGITSSLVGQITTNQTNIANLQTGKQDVINDLSTIRSQASTALQPNDNITELTNNAGYTKVESSTTNGNIKIDNVETSVYRLPSDVAFTDVANTFTQGQIISRTDSGPILKLTSAASDTNFLLERQGGATCVLESGGSIGLFGTKSNHGLQIRTSYVNRMSFDTSGGVTLATAPAANSNSNQIATTKWVNDKGYITGISSGDVVSALGFTPYNSTNPSNYQTSSEVSSAINAKAVRYDTSSQGLTSTQQGNARTNINAQEVISDLSTIRSQAGSALQPNDNVSSLVNDAGYITTITDTMVTTALGYTPYNSSNPNGYQTSSQVNTAIENKAVRYDTASQGLNSTQQSNARANIGAGTSNFSGSYSDLSNKPTLGTASSKDTGTTSGTIPLIGSNGKLDSSIIPTQQITIDSALSSTSENPVQNKVINSALSNKLNSNNPSGTGTLTMTGNIQAAGLTDGTTTKTMTEILAGGGGSLPSDLAYIDSTGTATTEATLLDDYYNKTQVNNLLSDYYNESEVNNLLANKVDKTTSSSRLYGTNSSGGQTTLTYSSGNQNASTIPLRDANGDIRMNAMYSNNGKIYTKNFYNYSSDQRYCHIGVLKAEYSNQTFAGKIYTSQGYGDTDSQQEFIDFTVTINNNEHLGGFATCVYNNPPTQDECQILFVPTSNSWEWDMLLKMHSWTNALVELKMSAPNASGFKFTFDSSDANFVSQPSSTELTITPRRLSEFDNYYVRFESGLQICWGRATNASNNATQVFPRAFATNTSVFVYVTQRDVTSDWNNNLKAINIGTTSFGVNSGGTTNFDWLAIGRWR